MKTRDILPEVVFARAREPREISSEVRLRALEWALYFAITGKHTVAEIGREMRVEAARCDSAFTRLVDLGLIVEREIDAAEYVRALATSGDQEEKSLREFLMIAAQPRDGVDPTAPTAEAVHRDRSPRIDKTSAPGIVSPALAERTLPRLRDAPPPFPPMSAPPPGQPTIPASTAASAETARAERAARPAFGFKPLPLPHQEPSRSTPGTRRLSLRALMNLIERQAGSRDAGQLDIYRVFVRVDTFLLKRNGINTLRFTEDRLVSDPELEQAIVGSVKKTLGLVCPDSVWVNGA